MLREKLDEVLNVVVRFVDGRARRREQGDTQRENEELEGKSFHHSRLSLWSFDDRSRVRVGTCPRVEF